MARVTALTFTREHNMGKDQFVASFRQIWKANIHCSDMRLEETVRGFLYLKKLLLESISAKEGMTRTFSAVHTEEFIKTLDELADVSSREDLGSKGSVRERRKICVKENKRHPFSQESEQGKT